MANDPPRHRADDDLEALTTGSFRTPNGPTDLLDDSASAPSIVAAAASLTDSVAANNNNNNNTADPTLLSVQEQTRRQRRMGRERLGGYLLFKLLLIAAVVEPDTLDLLILLSWYTLLSFLRSLAHLAGYSITSAAQSGRPPRPGALRLLVAVMVCNASAAFFCVALFHAAGWNMLLLLTCDCVLLGADAMVHVVRHMGATMEERHRGRIAELEERQVRIHVLRRERNSNEDARGHEAAVEVDESMSHHSNNSGSNSGSNSTTNEENNDEFDEESRQVDREVEVSEATHTRRMSTLDTIIFSFEVFALILSAGHFGHIWVLHGASFGLVDAILALQVNSTVSAIFRKVSVGGWI